MTRLGWTIILVLCACNGCLEPVDEYKPVDECPDDPQKTRRGACGCGVEDIFDITAGDYTCNLKPDIDLCPNDPNKINPGICGCGTPDADSDRNGIPDCVQDKIDLCPDDPNKRFEGVCGCGVPDVDENGDTVPDCIQDTIDLCPEDDKKIAPGECGCGVTDLVYENQGTFCKNVDLCPNDPKKTNPGICGCGVPDVDLNRNGTTDCIEDEKDYCPNSNEKRLPGVCGCAVSDKDIDSLTKLPECLSSIIDLCPNDPKKTRPGTCGCGGDDTADKDGDTVPDCIDQCPDDRRKSRPGVCGCGVEDNVDNIADSDKDGAPNCVDACPEVPWKSKQDACDSCQALEVDYGDTRICAQTVSNAEEFIRLRDDWNAGAYPPSSTKHSFMLVNDINLGDRLTQAQADRWTGIGTEQFPFDGILLGNTRTISAVRSNGKTTETLTLGNQEASYVGIFAHTRAARIDNLILNLSFTGKSHVAPLAARAEGTHVSLVSVNHCTVTADTYGAGLIAHFYAGSMKDVFVLEDAEIHVSGELSGGISSLIAESQVSHAIFLGSLNGQNTVGGIAGRAEASTLSSSYTMGEITGGKVTGGIVGELASRSSLLNAYTTSRLVCKDGPCALMVARVLDSSTISNGYSAGRIAGEIQTAPTNPDQETHGKGAASGSAGTPEQQARLPRDGGRGPEDGEGGGKGSEVPIASLVASVASENNVVDKIYYWARIAYPPIPEDINPEYIRQPDAFDFPQLKPFILDPVTKVPKTGLLDTLSGNLLCYGENDCTLKGVSCLDWVSSRNVTIYIPGTDKPISVHLPMFDDQ